MGKTNKLRNIPLLTGAAAVLPFAAAAAAAAAQAQGNAAASPTDVAGANSGDIVVTAQKREERLRDVPVSISVMSGRDLDRSTSQGVDDVLRTVPGVATTSYAAVAGTQLSIRGVTASAALFAGASPIAYYLDGLPFGLIRTALVPDSNAYDLERVEVLRGPQGTLYGASALNGVVRILTKDADLSRVEGKARVGLSDTEHGGLNYRGDASINVPIVEGKLAVRATVGYQKLSGWIDKPNQANANDGKIQTYRLKVDAAPTERLTIGASAWVSRAKYGALSFGYADLTIPDTAAEPQSSNYDAFGLKVGYDFDSFVATSNTSYMNYRSDSFVQIALVPVFVEETLLKARTFNEELNLSSKVSGPWKWTAGAMFRHSNEDQNQPIPGLFPKPLAYAYSSESYAVFGELTRQFFDGKVELTAGLRYFHDHIQSTEVSTFTGAAPAGKFGDDTFHNVSPRVVLNWHPEKELTVYASYSQGFRSGGSISPAVRSVAPNFPPLQPDKLNNYEIGSKGSLLGGLLVYDAALYYIDWKDIQQSLLVRVGTVNIASIINSKSGSGLGGELGVSVRPVPRLTLNGNVAFNNLKIDADVLSGAIVLFPKGSRLNQSPKYTAGGSIAYSVPFGRGYEGKFAGSLNYVSASFVREMNATNTAVVVRQGEHLTTGTLSFALQSPSRWTATLFIDNFTNENRAPMTDQGGFPYFDQRIRPRTFGGQLEYRF